ncbi:MAG: cytochrome c oxidase subunit II [Vulcanimicrobiaceae bacterium]
MPARGHRAVSIAFAAAAALSVNGCSFQPLPPGATEQAKPAHDMWVLFSIAGLGVALLIWGLIFWCVFRYRRRDDDDGSFPAQFRRNDRMEIVYTALPIVLVAVLFGYTYAAERHIETIAPQPDVVVDVSAYRWSWRFRYPKLGVAIAGTPERPPEFLLPVGQTTRLNVTSVDVDHSFWVPAFLFKRDAIPGVRNVFDWTPVKLGTFRGECGEYCGLKHALMSFTVRVVSPQDFERWVLAERRTTPGTNGGSH